MKFTLVLMTLLTLSASTPSIVSVRKLFFEATESATANERLLKATENATIKDPVRWAYLGVSHTMKANHVSSPVKKLSHFNKGKKMLDEAVTLLPDDIEPRFLRLTVQLNAPSFLNYNRNIEQDKDAIVKGLRSARKTKKDNFFIDKVVKFLKTLDFCTPEDLITLKALE